MLPPALPWVIPPVLADVLVFVIAIVIVKFRPQGLIFRERGLTWPTVQTTVVNLEPPPVSLATAPLRSGRDRHGRRQLGRPARLGQRGPAPSRSGIATDLTGPIGFAGNANAKVAQDGGRGDQ